MNLYEMLERAQGGNAFATLARTYGLSEAQVRQAVEAFTPAFAASLQRNTADPTGFYNFMQTLASGRHAGYYDDPTRAASGAGVEDGNAVLGQLFGSKELSRAVANHVAASTGLGEALLKQMLPVIAAMLMGGLFRQGSSGGNPILDAILRQMSGGMFGGGPQAAPRPEHDPYDPARQQQASPFPGQAGDNPFGRMFEDMLGGLFGGAQRGSAETGGRAGAPQAGSPNPNVTPPRSGADVFGEMFEPSRRMGEAYTRSMQDVVDSYLKGMNRLRQG